MDKVSKTFNAFPFSIVAYIISLVPWAIIYIALIRINLDPAPKGIKDFRGEFLTIGVIFALLLAGVLVIITSLNLIFQKSKSFYTKLLAVIIIGNLVLYSVGMIV